MAKSLFLRFGHHLDKWLARTVFELSSGERQLLRLLCVLGQPQELYLLDEPEVHLDGFGRTCLAAYLSEIDAAVVLVSHDVSFRSSVVHDEIRIDSIE